VVSRSSPPSPGSHSCAMDSPCAVSDRRTASHTRSGWRSDFPGRCRPGRVQPMASAGARGQLGLGSDQRRSQIIEVLGVLGHGLMLAAIPYICLTYTACTGTDEIVAITTPGRPSAHSGTPWSGMVRRPPASKMARCQHHPHRIIGGRALTTAPFPTRACRSPRRVWEPRRWCNNPGFSSAQLHRSPRCGAISEQPAKLT